MLYIEDEDIKTAFLTMMNKLVYGHNTILKPLLRTLRGMDDKDRLLRIQKLEICIEGNTDRKQILTNLMATGVLEPAVFNKENNALIAEEHRLRAEKDKLVSFVGGDKVRNFFAEYISGKSLKVAAETVGLKVFHGSAGRMLRNTHYLGDDYYPAIIDLELFNKAEEERQSRANQLGRVRELTVKERPAIPLHFTMGKQTKVCYDPYEQAEYAYSLIESEV